VAVEGDPPPVESQGLDPVRTGREDGVAADVAEVGEDAVWMAGSTEYDAIVLDVMLPGIDGFEVCRRLRADDVRSPVLMLTARDAVDDRVRGLDTGADDYLVKPFSFAELCARLRALVRRGPVERAPVLVVGDLSLDPATRQVRRAGAEIRLSAREFQLLRFFIERRGEVVTREQLLDGVWGYENMPFTRTVDMHIAKLRKKIEDTPDDPHFIVTVHRMGYKFNG